MKRTDVVFFDLFFTLVVPAYGAQRNEYDVLGMTAEEWEAAAEDEGLYLRRASGIVNTPDEIIAEILRHIPRETTAAQRAEILRLRTERMRRALIHVDPGVLRTLQALCAQGRRLCVISNADAIDTMHWRSSPLAGYFEDAVFSHEVGCLKPDPGIYQTALRRIGAEPARCLFVGDGGSDELRGARELGMRTVLAEHFDRKPPERRQGILQYADYIISTFEELTGVVTQIG